MRICSYLDSGDEVGLEPCVVVDLGLGGGAIDGGGPGVWVLSGGVVTPDGDFLKEKLDFETKIDVYLDFVGWDIASHGDL